MSIEELTAVCGVIGGIVLFGFALHQWRDSLQWRRAEKLDAIIRDFDSVPLLLLGRTIVDWTARTVTYEDRDVTITNVDALLALRDHRSLDEGTKFPGQQPLIRDALDRLLSFFEQLNLAIATRLVDRQHAKRFFAYWVAKLVTFDQHPIEGNGTPVVPPEEGSPEARMARYIKAYANIDAIIELCEQLEVAVPGALRRAREKRM